MDNPVAHTTTTIAAARNYFLGDVASIVAFALLARAAHRGDMPFTFGGWMMTAWPFLAGIISAWLVLWVGKLEPAKIAPAGIIVWVTAVVTGLGIWGIKHGAIPHWSFMIVASSTSAALLLGYRAIAAKIRR